MPSWHTSHSHLWRLNGLDVTTISFIEFPDRSTIRICNSNSRINDWCKQRGYKSVMFVDSTPGRELMTTFEPIVRKVKKYNRNWIEITKIKSNSHEWMPNFQRIGKLWAKMKHKCFYWDTTLNRKWNVWVWENCLKWGTFRRTHHILGHILFRSHDLYADAWMVFLSTCLVSRHAHTRN